ncbi:transposase family protein [Escherichia coli]|nr:transposase family protein [Escherichia coli]
MEHKLSDILLLTICAVISGAEGWEDIEDFGETHLDFLKQYGDFENGITAWPAAVREAREDGDQKMRKMPATKSVVLILRNCRMHMVKCMIPQ